MQIVDKRSLDERVEREWKGLTKHCPDNAKKFLQGFDHLNIDK